MCSRPTACCYPVAFTLISLISFCEWQGERFSLNEQVLNFENNLNELRTLMGGERNLSQYLARSIVVMVFGSNDYINNYLLPPLYPTSYNYTPEEYANNLLDRYTRQILVSKKNVIQLFIISHVTGCMPN